MSNRGHILVAGPAGPALDDTALILDQRGFATTVAPDAVTLGDLRADAVVLVGDPDADAAVGLTSTVCTERPGLPVVLVLAADREELLPRSARLHPVPARVRAGTPRAAREAGGGLALAQWR